MILRNLLLAFILINTSFAQTASQTYPRFDSTHHPLTNTAFGQSAGRTSSGFDPTYKLKFGNPVQDKNFYLLSLFQRHPEVGKLLRQNRVLRRLADDKQQALRAAATCSDVDCFDRLFRFPAPTIELVAAQLKALSTRPEFKRLVMKEMRPSGAFIKYAPQSDSEMLVAAWKDAAHGLNRLLRVYGLGKAPYYKDIDRVSFDVSTEAYRTLIKSRMAEIKLSKDPLFFEPTLNFALKLLEANRRDEAGRYEPLEEGENKATLQNLKDIKWSDYPYSFILVLGSGSHDLSLRMSKIGSRRTDQGAQLFLERKAPLIILSGGHVHPMQTPFNEAIEMKKYLMEKFKIAEQSILIEPFARHTTTNFRNAARLAFRYGIPVEKALVTSSEDHIALVSKPGFRIRCTTELGYFPMEFITQISPVVAEFKPSVASLFFDANDPLDP